MNWQTVIREEFARINKRVDDTVVEEMSQHAGAAFEAARAEGAGMDDATLAVGTLIRSWCQDTSGPRRLDRLPLVESAPAAPSRLAGLSMDVRHAFRLLRRQPGFALVSIAMIALGVGATTSIFSVVNAVLLKPLPWRYAERVVRLYEAREGSTTPQLPILTNATYLAWKDSPTAIDEIGGYSNATLALSSDSGAERVTSLNVTSSVFPLLGAAPLSGRLFSEADEAAGNTVMLSYGFWQERYGGSKDVVGRSITLDGTPRTIIGVMPREFEFPNRDIRLWVPFKVNPPFRPGSDASMIQMFAGIARLKPGATPQQAAAEGSARGASVRDLGLVVQAVFGSKGAVKVTAKPMLDAMTSDVKPALWVLLAAVGLLLAAAVGNVANMQLSHATSRRREIAIRAAIGAGSGRLARQLFVETATTAVLGGVAGMLLTYALLRVLPSLLPADFPRMQDVAIDARVLGAAIALTALVSISTGLLPVRMARRVRLNSALVEDGSAPVGQSLRSPAARSRALIITSQVAIAAVLLVGAALLSRSFIKLLNTDRGYVASNLMTARVTLPGRNLPAGTVAAFYTNLIDRLKQIPGVTHAGFTASLPLTPGEARLGFRLNPSDNTNNPANNANAILRFVSADYFQAMGIRMAQGRAFGAGDTLTSEPVAVVNESFARRYLGRDPVSTMLPIGVNSNHQGAATQSRIVGIATDVKHRSAEDPVQPELYNCVCQMIDGPLASQYLTLRTSGDPAKLSGDLRSIVRAVNSGAVTEQVMTMEARLVTSLARPRLYALLLGAFATFALLISGIGLYGGLSYGVTQRTREIGLRTALGATPRDIVTLIVKQGIVMTLCGLVLGMGLAAAAVRYLSTFLFGVAMYDISSFVSVAVLLSAVAIVACALPARRAARIDPLKGLRS